MSWRLTKRSVRRSKFVFVGSHWGVSSTVIVTLRQAQEQSLELTMG